MSEELYEEEIEEFESEDTEFDDADGHSLVPGMVLGALITGGGVAALKFIPRIKEKVTERREQRILDKATAIDAKYKAEDAKTEEPKED